MNNQISNYTNMKINYMSLGCKVNLYETVAIINKFIDNGFKLVDFNEQSDVTIINTCTVTQTSDSKSRKIIRQAAKNNPNAIICVMGCYSQLNSDEAASIDGVDIVVGTSNRHLIYDLVIDLINKKLESNQNIYNKDSSSVINKCEDYECLKTYEDLSLDRYDNKTRAFVKIQDGCENFCSYCTIPYSRGYFRSRNKDSVIEEIKTLTKCNTKEIVLTGINTGAYGKDFENYNLSHLLLDIIKEVPDCGRIRISSIEITEVTDELISTIKNNKKYFCNHLHIPLQGGSDYILKKMNRKYDTKYYMDRIAYVRKELPFVNITADILCGFNGETDELFEDAYKFISEVSFGETHIFPYSPRVKTKAYEESKKLGFKDRINGTVLKERTRKLLELNKVKAIEYRKNFIDSIQEVLVETVSNGVCFGHTSNYLQVSFKSNTHEENDLVKVKITKIGYPVCEGVINNE